MKPTNKLQKEVVKASASLRPITDKQIQWCYAHSIEYKAHKSAKGIMTCTCCGHKWQNNDSDLGNALLGCECPKCNAQLKVDSTRRRVFKECEYFSVITTCKGFQVIRYVMTKCTLKTGALPTYTHAEVMQRWIAPNGKTTTLTKSRQCMGTMYYDSWIFSSALELRRENAIFDRIGTGEVYPIIKVVPELTKRGFKKQHCPIDLYDLFHELLGNNTKVETLLKLKQDGLLKHFYNRGFEKLDKYWTSIRICLRHKYNIENASDWCDYIDLLRYYERDVNNPKFVCPDNFKAEHDRYAAKRQKERDAEQLRRQRQQQEREERQKQEEEAFKQKAEIIRTKIAGLQFTDGFITVRALTKPEEYKAEGKAMHHCVASYYSRPRSLILSASINGKRIETVEVSLTKFTVAQSRGVCNSQTEYHDTIISFVEQNMPLIQRRIA